MSGKFMNVIVAGKSGAGKQPRVDVLTENFGLTQLATGNIFREYLGAFKKLKDFDTPLDQFWKDDWFVSDDEIKSALKSHCDAAQVPVDSAVLGLKAARFVDAGLFVPDKITNDLFAAAFRKADGKGLVLDGYPRTIDQSKYLVDIAKELGVKVDFVLLVENEDEKIVARTTGRRICPNKACGKVFHLEFKPPKDGKCTKCDSEVILRSDDSEEKIRKRLQEFQDALAESGIPILTVSGDLPVFSDEAVKASVLDAIAPVNK